MFKNELIKSYKLAINKEIRLACYCLCAGVLHPEAQKDKI